MLNYFLVLLALMPQLCFCESIKKTKLIDANKITEIFFFLIIILIAIFAISYIAKKFRFSKRYINTEFEISNIISLTTKDKLIILKTKNERILLGLSPGRISYLCPLSTPRNEHNYDD